VSSLNNGKKKKEGRQKDSPLVSPMKGGAGSSGAAWGGKKKTRFRSFLDRGGEGGQGDTKLFFSCSSHNTPLKLFVRGKIKATSQTTPSALHPERGGRKKKSLGNGPNHPLEKGKEKRKKGEVANHFASQERGGNKEITDLAEKKGQGVEALVHVIRKKAATEPLLYKQPKKDYDKGYILEREGSGRYFHVRLLKRKKEETTPVRHSFISARPKRKGREKGVQTYILLGTEVSAMEFSGSSNIQEEGMSSICLFLTGEKPYPDTEEKEDVWREQEKKSYVRTSKKIKTSGKENIAVWTREWGKAPRSGKEDPASLN